MATEDNNVERGYVGGTAHAALQGIVERQLGIPADAEMVVGEPAWIGREWTDDEAAAEEQSERDARANFVPSTLLPVQPDEAVIEGICTRCGAGVYTPKRPCVIRCGLMPPVIIDGEPVDRGGRVCLECLDRQLEHRRGVSDGNQVDQAQ